VNTIGNFRRGVYRGPICFFFCLFFFGTFSGAVAQQSTGKLPRVAYLAGSGDPKAPGAQIEAFLQGLRELGYIEGRNIHVEYRYVEQKQDRVPGLVAELLKLNPDVLVIPHTGAIFEAKRATKTIPIVIVSNVDPVATGIIDNLARPAGNITGVTRLTRDLAGKRLELLKEVLPGLSRVGVLWDGEDEGSEIGFKAYEAAGPPLKVKVLPFTVRGPKPDLNGAVRAAGRARVGGFAVVRGPLLRRYLRRIADLMIENQLPCMCEGTDAVEAGGLMSYSSSDTESFKRAAVYVDKILKGNKPGDLPVEQATKFEFIVNLKTAQQIGISIPPKVLATADRIIR
jgi:putative tryptophan/tyrosine transport system substrate-binding protein